MQIDDMIMISIDDHVIEPPHTFEGRAPRALQDRMPKLTTRSDGTQIWQFEERIMANVALNAVVGRPREDYAAEPTNLDQIRKGCWDLKARLGDMDANGQLAGLNFPSMFGMAGQLLLGIADKEVAYAACRAWNDWHIDEWCGGAPGRMIPLGIVPLWDPELAAKEAKRIADKGCHAISFPPNTYRDGQGTFHRGHWDPLFKVCDENQIVLCLHFADAEAAVPSPECPIDTWISNMQPTMYLCASDLIFSPVLRKYKNIRFALSEGSIGWVPYFLERIDQVHGIHSVWTKQHFDRLPSEIFRDHVQLCFIQDRTGIKLREDIGVKNITWECDYPHADTVWPNCPEVLWKSVFDVPDHEIDMITHLNAMNWYNFDPFKHIKKEEATVGFLRARAKADGVDLSPLNIEGAGAWAKNAPDRPICFQDIVDQMKKMELVNDSTGMGRVAKKMKASNEAA